MPSARARCTADGGTGPHYPGHEADLFWRGSAILDLTAADAVIDITEHPPVSAGRRSG